MVFVFIAAIFFSEVLSNFFSWWRNIPSIRNMEASRFLSGIQIGMYVFAAYGIAEFLRLFRRKRFIIACCAIPILFSALFHYAYFARGESQTLEQSPEMSDVYKIWNWIGKNMPPQQGRVVYQNTLQNMDDHILGRSDVFALSGIFTGVPQVSITPFLDNVSMRSKKGLIFGRDMDSADAKFVSNRMKLFNSEYIVSVEPHLERKLTHSKLFSKETSFGPFTIFRLKDFKSEWISFKEDADYETLVFENQHLAFNLYNKSADNEALAKIAYYPLWRARLNKKPVEIKKNRHNLMKFILPDKKRYKLELSFSSFSYPWATISLLSLIMCITVIVYRKP